MKTRVRMYRQGLGDCFLLSFDLDGETSHVLIDCGVLLGSPDQDNRMRQVARHILETCAGELLAVVATHEHWDHLSGFVQAQTVFNDINIAETWFAWTENAKDDQAVRLRKQREARKQALAAALTRFEAAGLAASPSYALSRGLLGFFGEIDAGPGAAGRKTTRDCLQYLLDREVGERRFLEPGDTFLLPGRSDVRIFVLGPPRDEALIRKDKPSKRNKETFLQERSSTVPVEAGFMAALAPARAPAAPASRLDELVFPFDRYHRISAPEASNQAFFRDRYGFDAVDTAAAPRWRRIDDDWLGGGASDLALALDSDTNNTSLVLAIETAPGGDVILMAADAQVGNWLSWKQVEFRVNGRIVKSADLLARTVLYKVGHHASHNATLREEGLDLMTSDRLTAMIPVQSDTAEKQGWDMPHQPLYQELGRRCRGRILRIDEGMPAVGQLNLAASDRAAFTRAINQEDLFVEIVLG
jgi:hypothetical protein